MIHRKPTLRLTIRQPAGNQGNGECVLNDHLEAIDADGNTVLDLQHLLNTSTIEREVGNAGVVTLRLYGVEIRKEDEAR